MRDINLIPFATIRLFIRSWNYGYLTKGLVVSNIMGNIIIFVPMVILLWCMFKIMRKKYILLIVNFIIILGVEIAQYITGFGSCDIDDVMLNMVGVILACILVNRKFFRKLCAKLYIIEKTKENKEIK